MFKKIASRTLEFFKQHGQAMVLYALLTPLLFMCLGAGLDLGWYYLNVSRLQNAADAAAVAGAHTIINDTENFSGYGDNIVLIDKFYGDNDTGTDNIDTEEGDKVAANYALKNLSSDAGANPIRNSNQKIYAYTMNDNWGKGDNPQIKMTPSLYKIGDDFYYVVKLEENIQHLFMSGWFDAMNAPVTAIAMMAVAVAVVAEVVAVNLAVPTLTTPMGPTVR